LCVFRGNEDSLQRIFIMKCPVFTVRRVYRAKRFSLDGKRFVDDEEVDTEVWKWLKHRSKDFYSPGFDALVK
jgi:hypothetical protein